jgi:hypothetical protein
MPLAFILFAASAMATSIKRFVRHPQLTGVLLWALAHLFSNGDGRSLVLFGVFVQGRGRINPKQGPGPRDECRCCVVGLGRAEVGRVRGEAAARARELRAAQRLFTELGATGRAEKVAQEIA